MTARTADRPFDLVLFGATGFTGGLAADYLAAHLPASARWAIAGRDRARLDAVGERLLRGSPRAPVPERLHADVSDGDSLRAVAGSTRVVATTVGPYLEHGEPMVAACAAMGTDYVDLTGEPEFIDRMYLSHHAAAVESGARLVHACGFDSVPHDLGALFTVSQLPADVPLTVRGVVRSNAMMSGGTFRSALGQLARPRQLRQASAARQQREPRPASRRARRRGRLPRRDADLGLWLLPLPTVDPVVVHRSAAGRADYGPDFSYAHYAGIQRLPTLLAAAAGIGGLLAASQVRPLRRLLGARVPPGAGPSPDRRARSWFTVDFIGAGGGDRVHTQVRGGDPGYDETAKMLSEAAMCLAFDDNPPTSGQVTTAVAMADHLRQRLVDAGMSFTVLQPASQTEGRTTG
ncbi:saccharopine dehydrogenase family protein [Ornithinicoccus halotolerans]|uniref:saccharopine dehydrogenase family protein n=1 Tax=Ornithinicoccus halotolerans TaxID=1748220 RepID=UPI0012949C1F|nr:saccharopine dehydrogenase NADP-binding domain-containing protein [Ornithinicoccus halotolerans]